MRLPWQCTLIVVIFIASRAAAGPIEDSDAAYRRGDYAAAYALSRPLADRGDAAAQSQIGLMYDQGRGVAQSDVEAVRWYRLAADQGYAAAQLNLGTMFAQGRGVPQSDADAARLYRLAADQGYELAQFNLGVAYEQGKGVEQDYVEAEKWYRLAADKGML